MGIFNNILNFVKAANLASAAYKPTTPYTGSLPKGIVKNGTKGSDAKACQTFLNWCIKAGLATDSIAGPKTVAAIKKFQKQYGLTADGIFGPKSLAKAKTIVQQHKPKPKPVANTKGDKILAACKTQADWMKNAKYGSYKPVTYAHSKSAGTCVTYEGCVFQRVGALASGEYIWHTGKGYGTGKVTHLNSKTMTCTYMGNKTLASLKSTIQKGDCILLDDNKSGKEGSGGHVFFCTGEWSGNNPYIWDFEPNRTCSKTGKPRVYSGSRKVLAIVRLK